MAICPFCMHKISKKTMCYYYNEKISVDRDAGSFAKIQRAVLLDHGREEKNKGYINYWRKRFGADNLTGAPGTVLDLSEVDSLARAVGVELEDGVYDFGQYKLDLSDKYSPRLFSPTMEHQPAALLCPECENLFPLDYFSSDCITIALVGSSGVGKTAALLALMASNFRSLTGSCGGQLRVRRSFNSNDKYLDRFLDETLEGFLRNGIVPASSKMLLPPIFLKLDWQMPDGSSYSHNLCLIDTVGERWERHMTSEQIVPFLDSCDGIMYFVEPAQGSYPYGLPISKSEGVMPGGSGQQAVIAPLEDIFVPPAQTSEERIPSSGASAIYDRYFSAERRWRDKKCAFILSKLDYFLAGERYCDIIDKKNTPFFDMLVSYEQTPMERKELFDTTGSVYRSCAAHSLFDRYFPSMPSAINCCFDRAGWFAVSAFRGSPVLDKTASGSGLRVSGQQKRFPLNIHEPIMWLLSEIIPEKREARIKAVSDYLLSENED